MPENENDNIYIVPLTKEHIAEVCKIEKECFSDPWSKNMFCDLLNIPFAVNLAAVEISGNTANAEKVVGYFIFYDIFPECQILNVAVKESKRNMKIATRLFSAVFDYAKEANLSEFYLEVRPSNEKAIALYKKFGFKIDGVRKNYYKRPKEDAILMSLKLE
ncbi:MAG: ribosomal protein S18-alanine N-acetyltransferase [Oscillospiraceae bacterium]|nr:ribosomal protein S18-alanine N-acetyltransferase [Oscillospiraceae bacterium]